MIGYVGVDEQVDRDFQSALRRASLHRLRDRVFGRSAQAHVLSFEEARGAMTRWSQVYRGIRTVEVEKIVGSVGRWRDFDSDFLPRKRNMEGRWSRVDRAYHQGVELPSVSLYKIADEYFVVDGNHRISVARYHKVVTIDAEVIELRGHKRKAAAHEPRPLPGSPRRPSGAVASWLLHLWQHLRPRPDRDNDLRRRGQGPILLARQAAPRLQGIRLVGGRDDALRHEVSATTREIGGSSEKVTDRGFGTVAHAAAE